MNPGPAGCVDGSECVVCGATDLLALTVCPDCGGTDPRVADRLLFVSAARGVRRRDVQARLADLTGLPRRAEPVESASRGLRAVARVPARSAPRAIERLARQGIPVAARLPHRVWASVPSGFLLLLAFAVATGLWAGFTGTPVLLVTTPIFAGALLVSAVRGVRRPLHPFETPSAAPVALVPILSALIELKEGRARALLSGLARAVQMVRDDDLPPGLQASLHALLPVAARAAVDLAMIDDTLQHLGSGTAGAGQATVRSAVRELTGARARLEEYLLEVTGVLGRLQGASADALASAGARLHELVDDFRTTAEHGGALQSH